MHLSSVYGRKRTAHEGRIVTTFMSSSFTLQYKRNKDKRVLEVAHGRPVHDHEIKGLVFNFQLMYDWMLEVMKRQVL